MFQLHTTGSTDRSLRVGMEISFWGGEFTGFICAPGPEAGWEELHMADTSEAWFVLWCGLHPALPPGAPWTPAQHLQTSADAHSDTVLKSCFHCGSCPTFCT